MGSGEMSGQICLKWNSFLNNIATSFESLWQEDGLVDVTLASDGRCLTAHKLILSASSPFFKQVFQTNPCQHPVIILQDVRFTELEALLTFIYKGEVNIEEKNLAALLKAAETLQIRGLSGGDIFARESYKRLIDLTQSIDQDDSATADSHEARVNPKKKSKYVKSQNNSILEQALAPLGASSRSAGFGDSTSSKKITRADDSTNRDDDNDPIPESLAMKIESFHVTVEDPDQQGIKEELERLDAGQEYGLQGDREGSPVEDTSGLCGLRPGGQSTCEDEKDAIKEVPVEPYRHLAYADLLPSPDVLSNWATSRPMDHLACDLMKILFSPEERIWCNVNGKMGKKQFDANKIHLIREVLMHFSGMSRSSVEWEEAWKNCVTKIDTSNRGLKRYLFQRRSVYP